MIDLFLSLAEAMTPASSPATAAGSPAKPPAVSISSPAAPPATAAPPRPKPRLADANGQLWEHADAATLQAWITAHDAAILASRTTPPQVYFPIPQPTARRTCGPAGCR